MPERWYRQFGDATGLFTAEVSVEPGDDWYPAQVQIDTESGTLLDYDAEELGLLLQEAAQEAKRQNRSKPPGEGEQA